MERNIRELISKMTLEEKASLCSGLNFWETQPIERLGIPSIMVTDGPHGLRKQQGGSDHVGINDSVPATCFPAGATLACSWDRNLIRQVGVALGEECQAEDVAVLLGPAANIKRSPLCGRNFEYFSEDPYLSSQIALAHIEGVQSQGVGTSLKHFAVNNQEERRMSVDAVVDERTLREIYLASFEQAVKSGQPWTVMSSYNLVNGTYVGEDPYLLNDILKKEWGHEGIVVSDWAAVNERVAALKAGMELEMPGNGGFGDQKIIEAIKNGEVDENVLNETVYRLLKVIFQANDQKKPGATYDKEAHHQLARKVAAESMVLLRNEHNILPLRTSGTIAVIGGFANEPRYQGGGSSHIKPTMIENAITEIKKITGSQATITHAQGYPLDKDFVDQTMLDEAKMIAQNADTVVMFVGLPERYESEGYDRSHIKIPQNHQTLIEEIAAIHNRVIVVLQNGSVIEMPWVHKVSGILEAYLGGQATSGAIADLLFGIVNPSGKLAETFPLELAHNPSYLNFPGEGDKVEYKEGLFVGYRYYDTKKIDTLYPFGFGLSYTTFTYSNLKLDKTSMKDTQQLLVSVDVTNTGDHSGKEVVQLYVKDKKSSVIRPEKELKGFEKLELQPGETKTVSFTLDKRSFAYYNVDLKDWHVETGEFDICIAKSANEVVIMETVNVESTVELTKTYHRNSLLGDLMADPKARPVVEGMINQMQAQFGAVSDTDESREMMMAIIKSMPLRAMVSFSQGTFSEEKLKQLLDSLN